jgi:tetratricopeptide (TPR) repeat protein
VKTSAFLVSGMLAAALLTVAWVAPVQGAQREASLAHFVPDDVFLFVEMRRNPERGFVEKYWGEVFEALEQSGIGADLFELIASLARFDAGARAEIERIKQRATDLVRAVDWDQLAGQEIVFAERFEAPIEMSRQRPPVMIANMVWICRGGPEGVSENYAALVAILDALVEEVNRAAGAEVLSVERTSRGETEISSVDFLGMVPGAPALPLYVAMRQDVLIIALREALFADVTAMLEGSSSHDAIVDDPRFVSAFASLPAFEDGRVFFDLQALLRPIRAFVDEIVVMANTPSDVYHNTGMSDHVAKLNARAMEAYRRGDLEQALALTREVHEASPKNSIVLYNLACFSAQVGESDEALSWLDEAVEGGFYAPDKIANDSDLASLREDPRFNAAVARAAELAAESKAGDIIINSSKTGEAYRLTMQAWQVYQDRDFEQGLRLVEQAHAVAPHDPRPLYGKACFHALLGHDEKALEFLAQAVDAGYYCPRHIAKDPDLASVRGRASYTAAWKRARQLAAEHTLRQDAEKVGIIKQMIDRLADAVGILDYSAEVETTDGFDLRKDAIAVLAPNAQARPLYPVIAVPQLTDFDKYLPKETESFSVSNGVDFGALYGFITDSLHGAGPGGKELLAEWGKLQSQIGINVKEDFVDWIGSASISVTLAGGQESVWMVQVKDEEVAREKITAALDFITEKLPGLLSEHRELTGLAMLSLYTSPVADERLAGFQNLHIALAPQPAVWGVVDGYLIIGSSADAVALCLETSRGEHPGIRENTRLMSEMLIPDGPFSAVSLTDYRQFGEHLAKGIGIASMVGGVASAMIPDDDARLVFGKISGMFSKLAPVVLKIDFYKSVASYTTFDGQTYYTQTVTHYRSPEER